MIRAPVLQNGSPSVPAKPCNSDPRNAGKDEVFGTPMITELVPDLYPKYIVFLISSKL